VSDVKILPILFSLGKAVCRAVCGLYKTPTTGGVFAQTPNMENPALDNAMYMMKSLVWFLFFSPCIVNRIPRSRYAFVGRLLVPPSNIPLTGCAHFPNHCSYVYVTLSVLKNIRLLTAIFFFILTDAINRIWLDSLVCVPNLPCSAPRMPWNPSNQNNSLGEEVYYVSCVERRVIDISNLPSDPQIQMVHHECGLHSSAATIL